MSTQPIFYKLSDFSIITVQGEKAADFLQGQFTSDILLQKDNQAVLSAHCSPKGRILTLCIIIKSEGIFYLCTTKAMEEITLQTLGKYAPFSRIELVTCTDQCLIGADQIVMNEPKFSPWHGKRSLALLPLTHPICAQSRVDITAWHGLDMHAGLPRLSQNTSNLLIPQRLNLHAVPNTISFTKGCYVGQEIIARIHYLGQLKHRMLLGLINIDQPIHQHNPITTDNTKATLVDSLYLSKNEQQLILRRTTSSFGYRLVYAEISHCYSANTI